MINTKTTIRLLAGTLVLASIGITRMGRELQPSPDIAEFRSTGNLEIVWTERPGAALWTLLGLSSGVLGVVALTGSFGGEQKAKPRVQLDDELSSNTTTAHSRSLPGSTAPTIDIVSRVVETLMGASPNHILFASRTQAGKTSSVLGIMKGLIDATNGSATFKIVDPKNSYWGGFEDKKGVVNRLDISSGDFYSLNKSAAALFSVLSNVSTVIKNRGMADLKAKQEGKDYNPAPYLLIIDEYPTIKTMIKLHDDMAENKEDKLWNKIDALMTTITLTGLERRVFTFISGQSHQTNMIGLSLGQKDNFSIIAQGRSGSFQSVNRAVGDHNVISQKTTRDNFLKTVQSLEDEDKKSMAEGSPCIPVLFTNLGGNQVGRSIDLSDIKRQRLYTPPSATSNETSEALTTTTVGFHHV